MEDDLGTPGYGEGPLDQRGECGSAAARGSSPLCRAVPPLLAPLGPAGHAATLRQDALSHALVSLPASLIAPPSCRRTPWW